MAPPSLGAHLQALGGHTRAPPPASGRRLAVAAGRKLSAGPGPRAFVEGQPGLEAGPPGRTHAHNEEKAQEGGTGGGGAAGGGGGGPSSGGGSASGTAGGSGGMSTGSSTTTGGGDDWAKAVALALAWFDRKLKEPAGQTAAARLTADTQLVITALQLGGFVLALAGIAGGCFIYLLPLHLQEFKVELRHLSKKVEQVKEEVGGLKDEMGSLSNKVEKVELKLDNLPQLLQQQPSNKIGDGAMLGLGSLGGALGVWLWQQRGG
ncbi:hypothetical protein ABPG75_002621 [Micractinium tetrahymenae]